MKSEKYNKLYIFYIFLISYLLINTGMVSDDFIYIWQLKDAGLAESLVPKGGWLTAPLTTLTHYTWYRFFRVGDIFIPNLLKIFYILISFWLISKFFSIFLTKKGSLLASFLFIFFPSHDSTTYWFLEQSVTLSFAFYLYAYYLAYNERIRSAFFMALLGSFISYGSPALAIGLFMLAILNRKARAGLAIIVPNLIYICYYLFISKAAHLGMYKLPTTIAPFSVAKHFVMQILTLIDATLGPSMWLKIYYSFHQISLISFTVGLVAIAAFNRVGAYGENGMKRDTKLIVSFVSITIISCAMFALTGFYPQLAFNLGNRTTIFGSLLLTYLAVSMRMSKAGRIIFFLVILYVSLGISDHWKTWNSHQRLVMDRIKENRQLKQYRGSEIIYVSGNQYSKYGRLSHIEFFSEDVVDVIFKILLERDVQARPINKRHRYVDGSLVDFKYDQRSEVGGHIIIYDSEKDTLLELDTRDINPYIDSLPPEYRHWVQLWDVRFIKELAVLLMPRLRYALGI